MLYGFDSDCESRCGAGYPQDTNQTDSCKCRRRSSLIRGMGLRLNHIPNIRNPWEAKSFSGVFFLTIYFNHRVVSSIPTVCLAGVAKFLFFLSFNILFSVFSTYSELQTFHSELLKQVLPCEFYCNPNCSPPMPPCARPDDLVGRASKEWGSTS